MKISISIVTYNNSEDINNNVESLLSSDIMKHDYYIEIINNHSNFSLRDDFKNFATVIHNSVKPDWSSGTLCKDYNSHVIRNLKSLIAPAVDYVITSQDDVLWKNNLKEKGYYIL